MHIFLTSVPLIHIFLAKLGTLDANIVDTKEAGASGSTKTWTTQLLRIVLALLCLPLL